MLCDLTGKLHVPCDSKFHFDRDICVTVQLGLHKNVSNFSCLFFESFFNGSIAWLKKVRGVGRKLDDNNMGFLAGQYLFVAFTGAVPIEQQQEKLLLRNCLLDKCIECFDEVCHKTHCQGPFRSVISFRVDC